MLCWRSKEDHLAGRTYAWTNSRWFNSWTKRTDVKNSWKDSFFGFSRLFNLHSSVHSHPWPHSTRSSWNCCLQRYIGGLEIASRRQPCALTYRRIRKCQLIGMWLTSCCLATQHKNQERRDSEQDHVRVYCVLQARQSWNYTALDSWTLWLSVHVTLFPSFYLNNFLFKIGSQCHQWQFF